MLCLEDVSILVWRELCTRHTKTASVIPTGLPNAFSRRSQYHTHVACYVRDTRATNNHARTKHSARCRPGPYIYICVSYPHTRVTCIPAELWVVVARLSLETLRPTGLHLEHVSAIIPVLRRRVRATLKTRVRYLSDPWDLGSSVTFQASQKKCNLPSFPNSVVGCMVRQLVQ